MKRVAKRRRCSDDEQPFREALDRYRSQSYKTWGLTDCTSFLIMEQKGITEALSADREFQQAGFRALLVE